MNVRVTMVRNPLVIANDAALARFVVRPVVTLDGKPASVQKKPEERTVLDWNRLLQAHAKRAERGRKRREHAAK